MKGGGAGEVAARAFVVLLVPRPRPFVFKRCVENRNRLSSLSRIVLGIHETVSLSYEHGGLQTGRIVGRRGLLGSKPAEPEPEVDPYAHTLAKPFICDPDNTTVEDALKVIFNELGGGVDGEGEINTSVDGDPAALFQPIFLATLILKDAIAPTCW